MSDLVGNPEDRFSHNEAHLVFIFFKNICHVILCPAFIFLVDLCVIGINVFLFLQVCMIISFLEERIEMKKKMKKKNRGDFFFSFIFTCISYFVHAVLDCICSFASFQKFMYVVCSTVSSMLSGLETRSLGLNTLGTTLSPALSQSVQVSRTSTTSWV